MAAPSSPPSPPSSPAQPAGAAAAPAPLTHVEDALVRQVEWYLGRQNLETDYYLKRHMDQEYWVSLEVILAFPKMQRLGVSDPEVVASLLARASPSIDVDISQFRIRPSWAARSVLALSGVPPGTLPAAVGTLFTALPNTPCPTAVYAVSDGCGTLSLTRLMTRVPRSTTPMTPCFCRAQKRHSLLTYILPTTSTTRYFLPLLPPLPIQSHPP
jgi:hypothetical protein